MKKSFMLVGAICLLVCLAGPAAFGLQYFDSVGTCHVGSYPWGIASADFNGDGNADLVTANYAAATVSVLLGNGDGTFASQVSYSTGAPQYPYYVATGDMDGDGNIDIVTGGSVGLVFLYGVGDGTFGTANVYYFGESVQNMVVADFNNDTHLDVATAHVVRDSVGIHINNNDSTYTTHMVPAGSGTFSLGVGYLDADNYLDILVGCSDGNVWNLQNDQSGDFIPTEAHIGLLNDPAAIAIADLTGDNIGDFAIAHAVSDFLFTYANNGDGTYNTIGTANTASDNPIAVKFDDVNEDGEPDIIACIGTTDALEIYMNQGSAVFALDTSYNVGGVPKDAVIADFNNDGHLDIAATSNNHDLVVVFLSRISLILSVDDVDNGGVLPGEFTLEQNYPNPFNPETNIRFSLPEASRVKVEIFNMLGQSVKTLVNDYLTAGIKEVTWDGTNAAGDNVASGLYLYRIEAGQFVDSKTMVLLK